MTPIALSAAALIGALIALVIYHFTAVRPTLRELRAAAELHDGLLSGGASGAGERFAALERAGRENGTALSEMTRRVGELERLAQSDLSRVGFVRYDAFAPEGEPGFSYALALLNREGDGVVLTSIYSRNDTRTFGKSVSAFKPAVEASPEELKAIERARLVSRDGPAR